MPGSASLSVPRPSGCDQASVASGRRRSGHRFEQVARRTTSRSWPVWREALKPFVHMFLGQIHLGRWKCVNDYYVYAMSEDLRIQEIWRKTTECFIKGDKEMRR